MTGIVEKIVRSGKVELLLNRILLVGTKSEKKQEKETTIGVKSVK